MQSGINRLKQFGKYIEKNSQKLILRLHPTRRRSVFEIPATIEETRQINIPPFFQYRVSPELAKIHDKELSAIDESIRDITIYTRWYELNKQHGGQSFQFPKYIVTNVPSEFRIPNRETPSEENYAKEVVPGIESLFAYETDGSVSTNRHLPEELLVQIIEKRARFFEELSKGATTIQTISLEFNSSEDIKQWQSIIQTAAHDLRTPKTAITGYNELITQNPHALGLFYPRIIEQLKAFGILQTGFFEWFRGEISVIPMTLNDIFFATRTFVDTLGLTEGKFTFIQDDQTITEVEEQINGRTVNFSNFLIMRSIQNIAGNTYDQIAIYNHQHPSEGLRNTTLVQSAGIHRIQTAEGNREFLELRFADKARGKIPPGGIQEGLSDKKELKKELNLKGGEKIGLYGLKASIEQTVHGYVVLENNPDTDGVTTIIGLPL